MRPNGWERSKQSLALQLCEAIEHQSLQDIKKLLENYNADPNTVIPEKGISPFHLVIGSDSCHFAEETTRAFLQYDGNPNIRSEDGLTPLHVAAAWGKTGLLVLLLSCGGDPWLRGTESGLTPLHLALKEKHWETALILQRHQLMDRHNHHIAAPRFKKTLETVVVNAGEMQAEYVIPPQDNVSPVLMSPVQESKSGRNWNIESQEMHEYVRQWCHKSYTPCPITSTPTHVKHLNHNTASEQALPELHETADVRKSDSADRTVNITSSKQMTPKTLNITNTAVTGKNSQKNTYDVRKKLVLELKKRFNGLKQSFDTSKDSSMKVSSTEQKSNSRYFSRKNLLSSSVKHKSSINTMEENSQPITNVENDLASRKLSSRLINVKEEGSIRNPPGDNEVPFSLENSPVDEVDAVPLNHTSDTSLEWIASQSCFSEQNSPDSTTSQLYFTCDEGSSTDGNIVTSLANSAPFTQKVTVDAAPIIMEDPFRVPQRPPRRKQLKSLNISVAATIPSQAQSSISFGTVVSEEYRYTDDEAGVVLIESNILKKPVDIPNPSDSESVVSVPQTVISDVPTSTSDVSSVPASFSYDAVTLRKELVALGESVGPITCTTKKVYLRRLYHLKQKNTVPPSASMVPMYPSELQRALRNDDWELEVMTFSKLETLMSTPFESPDPNRRWRGGLAKSSFNYLLLDPRLSCNLPASVSVLDTKTWSQFISSVFYIGKGKRSRPYAHLYQAVHVWNRGEKSHSSNTKIQRILDIWNSGYGVVCLHIYQNIIPVEAFTREAAMLDAIGTSNLVNMKKGEYYGPASTWRISQKRQLGIYLLYRAMKIFLCEGERQLRPRDID